LLLLGPVPVVEVVVDVVHLLLGLGAVIARVIISSAYLTPWISFHSTTAAGVWMASIPFLEEDSSIFFIRRSILAESMSTSLRA